MTEKGFRRRLSAILSADVVGYSRLMGDDEEATVRTLARHRGLITALVRQHGGRVVDSPGDNILAEFTSVVGGVRCAAQTQRELRVRNAQLPQHRRMEFRMGIDLGDVIVDGDRIYGDGVKIAALFSTMSRANWTCGSTTLGRRP
jgi:adenylate cyclase